MTADRHDPLTPSQRSEVMRAVRRRDTAPELLLRRALWASGLRYRIHRPIAGTHPDLVFVGRRSPSLSTGRSWHGCPDHFYPPKTRTEYWRSKIDRNIDRDRKNDRDLRAAGWTVRRFWECRLNAELDAIVSEIQALVQEAHPPYQR